MDELSSVHSVAPFLTAPFKSPCTVQPATIIIDEIHKVTSTADVCPQVPVVAAIVFLEAGVS